jgi:hypothetical protein
MMLTLAFQLALALSPEVEQSFTVIEVYAQAIRQGNDSFDALDRQAIIIQNTVQGLPVLLADQPSFVQPLMVTLLRDSSELVGKIRLDMDEARSLAQDILDTVLRLRIVLSAPPPAD